LVRRRPHHDQPKTVPEKIFDIEASMIITDDFRRGYERGLKDGYERGREDGYEQGIKSGKRLAKGKSKFPTTGPGFLKSRGRPKVLHHEILVRQFIDAVDEWMRDLGLSLPAAISKYCTLIRRSWKGLERAPEFRPEQLLRLYKREKAQRVKQDISST
jgi:hypothetical protein